MSQSDNWPNDEDTNSQSPQSLTSQSEEDGPATPAPRSRLRPAGKRPVKKVARSELGIATSVRVFWKDVLKGKLDKAIEKTKKTCEASSTEVILSTTHHGTKDVTLTFDALSIDWRAIDKQRKEWNSLPTKRNKRNVVTISITFDHTVIEAEKEPNAAASAAQLHDIRERFGAGSTMTRSVAVSKAYDLMRCSGPPCKNGDYCWQYEGRHIRLFAHHIDVLADHLHAGRTLNGHHEVPETFRRIALADERLREENEEKQRMKNQQRKRKRHDSESVSSGPCHGQPCPLGGRPTTPKVVFPTSPLIARLEPRRDLLRAYDVWQIDRASDDEKESYKRIQQLNLERKYNLEMIVSNQHRAFQYYMENDVLEGVAWHYVCDIKGFYKLRKEQHAKNA